MPAITIKNIPEDLYDHIKKSAKENFRSLNNEIIYGLTIAYGQNKVDPKEFLASVKELQARLALPELTEEMIYEAKNEGRP